MTDRSIAGIPHSALALVLLAFVLRGGALWLTHDAELVKDENAYVQRAILLLEGKGFVGSFQSWVKHTDSYKIADLPQYRGAYQPPVYTVFVAAVLAVSDHNPVAVKFAQVVIGSVSVLLVYLLGCAWYDHRTGWWAALIAALYPNLIAFTHLLWSETLFILFFLTLILLLTRRPELPSRLECLAVGLILGITALTRSSVVLFAPVLLAWMAWQAHAATSRDGRRTAGPGWKEGLLRGVIICVAAAAVITPWTVRNYRVHDGFVLIDTNGPYNLWRGNQESSYMRRYEAWVPHYEWPFDDIPIHPLAREVATSLVNEAIMHSGNAQPTDLEIIAFASDTAWAHIFAEPGLFMKRVYYRMIDMWNPTSFLIRHFRLGAYGDVSPPVKHSVTAVAVVTYLVVLPLGIAGLALSWRDSRIWLVVLFIGFYTGIAAVAFGLTRFRLPLMPFFIIGAAHVAVLLADRMRAARAAGANAR